MSKASTGPVTFQNTELWSSIRINQSSSSDIQDPVDLKQPEEHVQFELPTVPFQINPSVADGDQVSQFISLNTYTEQVYDDYIPRQTEFPVDRDYSRPQVTKESLIEDGRDIINYLKQNRYAVDMNSKTDDYDVHSIINDFENSQSVDQLQRAVDRLQLLKSQLSKL